MDYEPSINTNTGRACMRPVPMYDDHQGRVVGLRIVVDMAVRGLCARPYPGRPKGCPKFKDKTKPDCPPHATPIADMIELDGGNTFAAYERYDLEAKEARFRAANPGKEWTQKQARNLLHWQKPLLNRVKRRAQAFIDSRCLFDDGLPIIVECPEGHGVQVFDTMAAAGVILERPIVRWVHKVVLIGYPIRTVTTSKGDGR